MSALAVQHLTKQFAAPRGRRQAPAPVVAVDDVSFSIEPGEIMALVGESGAGKSTVARIVAGLTDPTSGTVAVDGRALDPSRTNADRRLVQLVGQNPRAALNRRRRIGHALEQPLRVHGLGDDRRARHAMVAAALERVGLTTAHLDRRPGAVSGGELARVVLARALLLAPQVLVLDEPTASLDARTTRTIVELLLSLRTELGLTILVITHEIRVARRISDTTAVMHTGRIVEAGPTAKVLSAPCSPYTRALLDAVLPAHPREVSVQS